MGPFETRSSTRSRRCERPCQYQRRLVAASFQASRFDSPEAARHERFRRVLQ